VESPSRGRVRSALNALKPYLASFVQTAYQHASPKHPPKKANWASADLHALAKAVLQDWNSVFASRLPIQARRQFEELKEVRNRWAHEEPFGPEDTARALRVITAIAKTIGARQIDFREPIGSSTTPRRSGARQKPASQRAVMRALYKRWGNQPERLIREYAQAESRGEVIRKNNKSDLTPDEYARALLKDAERKGWLEE
jgi:hypothetical protein